MRMWMINPMILCKKHLLGEHYEIHMLVGAITKGKRITGFLTKKLIEPTAIYHRHDALVKEMERRGYKHRSPIDHNISLDDISMNAHVDIIESKNELSKRCMDCRENIIMYMK